MSHRSRHHHVHIREVGLPTPLARAEVQDVVPCDLSFRPSSNADVVAAPIDHAHDATQHPKSVCREDFSSSIDRILFGGDGEDFQLTIWTPLLDPQSLRARGVSKARRGGQPRHQLAPHHHYDASRSPETHMGAPVLWLCEAGRTGGRWRGGAGQSNSCLIGRCVFFERFAPSIGG